MKRTIVFAMIGLLLMTCLVAAYSGRQQMVKLCEKDTTTWQCMKGISGYEINDKGGRKPLHYADGSVRFKEMGSQVRVYLSTSYLNQEQEYQVTLVGQGSTETDTLLAQACDTPNQGVIWECGYWGDQGFYNFHIGTLGNLRKTRSTMQDEFIVDLPAGNYENVKFLVKQNSAPWNTYLFEEKSFNFEVI